LQNRDAAEDRGVRNASIDPRALAFRRQSTCDAQGNFHFSALPKGNWIFVASVVWSVPHIEQEGERPGIITSLLFGIGPPPEFDHQGGDLRKFVELHGGENEAILSGEDEVHPGKPSPQPPKRAPATVRNTNPAAPLLGVAVVPLPAQMAAAFKIPPNQGLWLMKVVEGSAAARAGLSIGDVILTANDLPWNSGDQMVATMNSLRAGAKLVLGITECAGA
jgi:membrane-associated protease RseP (regulator of RpoE activity)